MSTNYSYPVARVGIVGGGQLARMKVLAAHLLGLESVILDPDASCPASGVASAQIVGDVSDPQKQRELVESCDVTTFDIENIETAELIKLEAEGQRIYPSPRLLESLQNKLIQKQLLANAGIATSEFTTVEELTEKSFADFGYPLVQKTQRGGYDGRGVAVIKTADDFAKHLDAPSFIERFVRAEKELAVMVARSEDGSICSYPVVEMKINIDHNVLETVCVPSIISAEIEIAAKSLAERSIEVLDGVGVFGVEMFLDKEDNILINEIAPRTHNSGHYTIEACATDQFEQHLRAVTGLPLGSSELLCPAVMINLLGAEGSSGPVKIGGLRETLAIAGVNLHLYGKTQSKPYRKMGHITVLDKNLEQAKKKAEEVTKLIRIEGENS